MQNSVKTRTLARLAPVGAANYCQGTIQRILAWHCVVQQRLHHTVPHSASPPNAARRATRRGLSNPDTHYCQGTIQRILAWHCVVQERRRRSSRHNIITSPPSERAERRRAASAIQKRLHRFGSLCDSSNDVVALAAAVAAGSRQLAAGSRQQAVAARLLFWLKRIY